MPTFDTQFQKKNTNQHLVHICAPSMNQYVMFAIILLQTLIAETLLRKLGEKSD